MDDRVDDLAELLGVWQCEIEVHDLALDIRWKVVPRARHDQARVTVRKGPSDVPEGASHGGLLQVPPEIPQHEERLDLQALEVRQHCGGVSRAAMGFRFSEGFSQQAPVHRPDEHRHVEVVADGVDDRVDPRFLLRLDRDRGVEGEHEGLQVVNGARKAHHRGIGLSDSGLDWAPSWIP